MLTHCKADAKIINFCPSNAATCKVQLGAAALPSLRHWQDYSKKLINRFLMKYSGEV